MLRQYVPGAGVDETVHWAPNPNELWYEGTGTTDRRFLAADMRGSVISVSNSAGSSTAKNEYSEYGAPDGANTGRFQYTGQMYLAEIGIYYYKARMYNPAIGRFLQTDPIGYGGGMNLYGYVGNDPVNSVDPSGLAPCTGSRLGGGCGRAGSGGTPVYTLGPIDNSSGGSSSQEDANVRFPSGIVNHAKPVDEDYFDGFVWIDVTGLAILTSHHRNEQIEPPSSRKPGSHIVATFGVGQESIFNFQNTTDSFITEFGTVFVDVSGPTNFPPGRVQVYVDIRPYSGAPFEVYRSRDITVVSRTTTARIPVPPNVVARVRVTRSNDTPASTIVVIRI